MRVNLAARPASVIWSCTADYAAKRRILEIVFLNCRLDDTTLVPTMRKPFDILAEGLVSNLSRGDKTAIELIQRSCTGIKDFGLELMSFSRLPLFTTVSDIA